MIKTEFVVEIDNNPGALAKICSALGKNGVNIEAISTERIGTQGFVHVVVDDEKKAKDVLEKEGFEFTETAVIVKRLENKPNALADIARQLAEEGINIESLYLSGGTGKATNVVFVLDDVEAGKRLLG
ncbi:MAG: ACT domain-containing protein [Candidatus Diapherotrites archaeon]|nr:ACT domain-containing protein [Candidatus Diapherotrites archaeon]